MSIAKKRTQHWLCSLFIAAADENCKFGDVGMCEARARGALRRRRKPCQGAAHENAERCARRQGRSSRQGAFCGHLASQNATLFASVAPLPEKSLRCKFFMIAADIKRAAQRYAIPSASPPYSHSGAAMIADEKAARQKNHEKRIVFHGFLLF